MQFFVIIQYCVAILNCLTLANHYCYSYTICHRNDSDIEEATRRINARRRELRRNRSQDDTARQREIHAQRRRMTRAALTDQQRSKIKENDRLAH